MPKTTETTNISTWCEIGVLIAYRIVEFITKQGVNEIWNGENFSCKRIDKVCSATMPDREKTYY